MDGVSRHMGARVGLQLKALIGEKVEQAIWLDFPVSNNETEYEAIIAIVDLAQSVSLEKLLIHSDSQLVVGEVNGEYETREQRMARYVGLVKQHSVNGLMARNVIFIKKMSRVGVPIRVNGSCSCRVNVRIVSTFANPNPTRIITVSTFANSNPTRLLFVFGWSTRI